MTSLELQQVAKTYPGTIALKDFTVRWTGGQIHALIGRNGAGKSTLIKILTGALSPTSGIIRINGEPVTFRSPADARRAGIAAVYQELSLLPELSIAENIHLGRLPRKKGFIPRLVDWKEASVRTQALFERLNLSLSPETKVGSLPVAQQQLVEIAKAMSGDPSILLLDEPTSALSYAEAECVFALLRTLAARGVLILYITHRLGELRQLAGTITALRDGVCGGSFPAAEVTPAQMVGMMFGEDVTLTRMLDHRPETRIVLQVRGLSRPPAFKDVSFEVHEGEILGIAGLMGSGRTELLRAIAGADRSTERRGDCGRHSPSPVRPGDHEAARLVMTPENRKEHGLVTQLSTRANLCLADLCTPDHTRIDVREPGEPVGGNSGPGMQHRDPRSVHAGGRTERREPAEGRSRQMAGHRTEGAAAGRTDTGYRPFGAGADRTDDPGAEPHGVWRPLWSPANWKNSSFSVTASS